MKSILSNWNISIKYITMFIFLVIALTIDNLYMLVGLIVLILAFIIPFKLMKAEVLLKRFIKFSPFPLMIFITILISGIVGDFYEYFQFAVVAVMRIILGFCVVQILVLSGNFVDFIDALSIMHFPAKLCVIMHLMNRYIPLFHSDFIKMKDVLKSRFFISKTNIFSISLWSSVLGNMIVRSYEKSDIIYMAMKSRGVNELQFNLRKTNVQKINFVDLVLGIFFIGIAIWVKMWSL